MNDPLSFPPEVLAEMQAAAAQAMAPTRDPEQMRQACEHMDRVREEMRQKHGILDIGVPAIRRLRGRECSNRFA